MCAIQMEMMVCTGCTPNEMLTLLMLRRRTWSLFVQLKILLHTYGSIQFV